jgi:hypothetical protein
VRQAGGNNRRDDKDVEPIKRANVRQAGGNNRRDDKDVEPIKRANVRQAGGNNRRDDKAGTDPLKSISPMITLQRGGRIQTSPLQPQ